MGETSVLEHKCWNCDTDWDGVYEFCLSCHEGAHGTATPLRFGRYRVDKHLGAGAFGSVWRAKHPDIDRYVAIKQFRNRERASSAGGILPELRHGGKLDHPNFVRLEDAGVDDRWLAFEYIDGGSLDDKIDDDPQWVRDNFFALAHQIASALAYAHSMRLIHRDLKPANILLTIDGKVKIADFGLIRELKGDDLAQTSAGTPLYMAPEVLTGDKYDVGADLHSIGVVFYEMVSGGRRPFGGGLGKLVINKQRGEYPPLDPHDGASPGVTRSINRLLAPPSERLASAEILVALLRQNDPAYIAGNTIDDMQHKLATIYGSKSANNSPLVLLSRANAALAGLTGGLLHEDPTYGHARARLFFPRYFAWISAVCSSVGVTMSSILALKYSDTCPYCQAAPCECVDADRIPDSQRNKAMFEARKSRFAGRLVPPRTFEEYFMSLEDIYAHRDGTTEHAARQAYASVAKAMDALLRLPSLTNHDEVAVLHLEMAGVVAWFMALLRQYMRVRPDYFFVTEFAKLFSDGCYACGVAPCVCPDTEAEIRMATWRQV